MQVLVPHVPSLDLESVAAIVPIACDTVSSKHTKRAFGCVEHQLSAFGSVREGGEKRGHFGADGVECGTGRPGAVAVGVGTAGFADMGRQGRVTRVHQDKHGPLVHPGNREISRREPMQGAGIV
jgi:hypothetical protein